MSIAWTDSKLTKLLRILLDLERSEGARQDTLLYQGPFTARHIKIQITKSFDHFIAIYHLEVKFWNFWKIFYFILFQGEGVDGTKFTIKVLSCQAVRVRRRLEKTRGSSPPSGGGSQVLKFLLNSSNKDGKQAREFQTSRTQSKLWWWANTCWQ